MPIWIRLREWAVAPAMWSTLVALYLWRPVAGLMALSALSGFVVAQYWPRLGLHLKAIQSATNRTA